jgi:cytochrome c-type biogenesis protein
MEITNVTIGFAFIAGLASFLSPCVFPLVPAYIGYLGGRTAGSGGQENRWITFSHGVAFVLGFSIIFVLLGVATSTLYFLLYDLTIWLARVGGVLVIILGLHMIGVFRIPFLQYDLRAKSLPDRKWGYLSSAMLGVFFSAGWSPCIGPVLTGILALAATGGSVLLAAQLLLAYSAGLALPFLLASTQIGLVSTVIKRYGKLMRYVEIGMGIMLIGVGLLLFMGVFQRLAALGTFFDIRDELLIGQYLLIGFLVLTVLGLIPALIARNKGRNFFDWWIFGAGLFPIALPVSLFIKPRENDLDKESGKDSMEVGRKPL